METSNFYQSFRKRAHLTQREAAEKLGVCQASVSAYERGAKAPRADVVADMAQVYGCSIEELLGRSVKSSPKLS